MRTLFAALPNDIKEALCRVGGMARVVKRDYKGTLGIWQLPKLEAVELRLLSVEKVFDTSSAAYYWESKLTCVPINAVAYCEFIDDREPAVEEARKEGLVDEEIDAELELGEVAETKEEK